MAALRTSRLKLLIDACVATAVILVVLVGEAAAQSKSNQAAPQPKKVLFLHSFGPTFQPWATWSKEIRSELIKQSRWPLDIEDHSLVTARGGDDVSETKFVEYLGALQAKRSADLIVAFGAAGARFVQRHRPDLFPSTPMLLAAVEVRRVDQSRLSEQDAVAPVRTDYDVLFENVMQLLPETKTIAMVVGSSPAERFWMDVVQREVKPRLAYQVEIVFYNELPFDEILKKVASLPPHSAIFYQQVAVDGAGAVYADKEPWKRIGEVANAPMFSYDLIYFTGETVGGPMHSPTEGAGPMAAAAVRLLAGEKASDVKVSPIEFSPPKYDWRQLQRWNISESRLPQGSEVLFREPTAWERYSLQIAFTVAVLLIQTGFILLLLNSHRRRRLAEVQSAQRTKELAHVNRFSMAGELTASIAHEINQPLGAILTNAETVKAILTSPSPDIAELNEIVDEILHDNRRASEVIRRTRSLLKKAPFDPQQFDLNEVARETVALLSAVAAGRKFELSSLLAPTALPIVCDHIQLQQVIINLVVNAMDAMKDTPAEKCTISVRTSSLGNFAELSVSDLGPGIPEDKLKEIFEPFFTSKAEGMGMGLSIARTIIEAHSGQISAENRPHGGASFRIRLPLI